MGFPSGSAGKKSACKAGDMGSIARSRRSLERSKWQPIPVFLPKENPMDRGAWRATVHGVSKSQT